MLYVSKFSLAASIYLKMIIQQSLVKSFFFLIWSACLSAQEIPAPQNYFTPDGTELRFGAMIDFYRGTIDDILDIQPDLFIPGNFLTADYSSLRTVNTTDAEVVIGEIGFNGYKNGAGTAARVSYPASCQITAEIVLTAEYWNHCVRILNRTNDNTVSDFAGTCLTAGSADGVGTAASFTSPVRIIQDIDDPNLVFVAEGSGNIRLIEVDTQTVSTYLPSGFSVLNSILFDTYYCGFMLIADDDSFKRLNLNSFLLTTYGTDKNYTDGSLDVGKYNSIYDATVLYKDTYVVVDQGNQKLRLIDTASCQVTTIQDTDSANDSYSIVFTDGNLYIGGQGYILQMPVDVILSGAGEMTTAGPGCSPVTFNTTRSTSELVDEPSCEQMDTTSTTEVSTTSTEETTTTTAEPTTTIPPITTATPVATTTVGPSETTPTSVETTTSTKPIPATTSMIPTSTTQIELTTHPVATRTTLAITTTETPMLDANTTDNYTSTLNSTTGSENNSTTVAEGSGRMPVWGISAIAATGCVALLAAIIVIIIATVKRKPKVGDAQDVN